MKYEYRYCRIFLLVNALVGFLSGAGDSSKFTCPGDSVQAFQNITFNNCSSVVSLYTNGERHTLIARWSFHNCSRNETFLPDFKERVFLYGNGTITIHDIHPWDQAKYIVNCQMGNFSMQDVVQINVMAAPAKDCRPKILHLGNSLFASLKANLCGKPVATLYWKGYSDVSNTSDPVLKLTPGIEAVTYYACIKGPALQCGRNSTPLDYCTSLTIGRDTSSPVLPETWDVKAAIFIVVGIVVGVSLIVAIVLILCRKTCRKKNVSGEQAVTLEEIRELWTKHFDSLKFEEISQLLNDGQQQGFNNYCDNLHTREEPGNDDQNQVNEPCSETLTTCEKSANDEQQQVLRSYTDNFQAVEKPVNDGQDQVMELYRDSVHETKDATTDHQPSTSSEAMREFQELRDAAMCKICFVNKKNIVFIPCNHVVTCANCGTTLEQCPVCRVKIEQRTKLSF
ncbi:hypothetical protein CHS0354_025621 [Potamilus streckersoni]|uniref:RING-type domain-containing protein n=1 Tax=Potamilus streckersoni TaxID=2493646 RepID=A0AAE0S1H6_9BIVA|nr:hypothetical protein CHS0354_025621 [Potamilus streckersoni]